MSDELDELDRTVAEDFRIQSHLYVEALLFLSHDV